MGVLEVCAGGVEDCLNAQVAGADRIELNSALFLGGLTPSVATLREAIERGVTIPIICMIRPRAAGFCYSEVEKAIMFRDAALLLQHGAKGLSFGFLTADQEIDWQATERMIHLCHRYQVESVFHRAFDCAKYPEENLQRLSELGCTRVLTSGHEVTVTQGLENLASWQQHFGDKIQLLCGCGVSVENIPQIIQTTGIHQVHGSFKKWQQDPTTTNKKISYAYTTAGDYEVCDLETIRRAVAAVAEQE